MNTKTVKIENIKTLFCNPPSRTESGAIADIIRYVAERIEAGKPPLAPSDRLLIGKDGVLGDGHRRLAALKHHGVKQVEVEIDEERTGLEIYSSRSNAKPLTSRHATEAVRAGMPREMLTATHQRDWDAIEKMAGDGAVTILVQMGGAFGIRRVLSSLLHYLDVDDVHFGRKALKWLLVYRQQRIVRHAIEYMEINPVIIRRAIENDRPLRLE
jgi:hypothetical protein